MVRETGPTVVAVINMKGGVGKSTIATLLCHRASAGHNLDVLAVDVDPQANMSQALMGANYTRFLNERGPSIVEIFNGYQPPRSDLGSPRRLSAADVAVNVSRFGNASLQALPCRFDFSDNLLDSLRPDPHILARFLSENFLHKDLIVIDCAPTESVLTYAAYHASSQILVPVRPEYFATIGFPLLSQSLETFRARNRGHQIEVAGIVINNWSYHYSGNRGGPEVRTSLNEIRTEAEKNDWVIFKRQIPYSRGFPKLMRGDFSHLGDSYLFDYFADDFLAQIGLILSPER